MSDQQHNPEVLPLDKVSAELTSSLDRCRALVHDCKAKLAANSNERWSNDDERAESDVG